MSWRFFCRAPGGRETRRCSVGRCAETGHLAVLRLHGQRLPEGIQDFLNKAAAIDLMGIEKLDGATAAEVEGMLKQQFGTSLKEVYHELNELTVSLNERIARLNGDKVASGVVNNL